MPRSWIIKLYNILTLHNRYLKKVFFSRHPYATVRQRQNAKRGALNIPATTFLLFFFSFFYFYYYYYRLFARAPLWSRPLCSSEFYVSLFLLFIALICLCACLVCFFAVDRYHKKNAHPAVNKDTVWYTRPIFASHVFLFV